MSILAKAKDASPTPPSLQPLMDLVADNMEAVDALIMERMQSGVPLISQVARHIIASGGKRIRPMLTLASAKLCGYDGPHHIGLAACVEFIHTATLLHDDVVDASALRRGNPSANALYGNKASVLVGDFLFSRAFEVMVEPDSMEVLQCLAAASSILAEGEVTQLASTNDTRTDETKYMRIITSKTAHLFAAACRVGAILAEVGETDKDALEKFGTDMGVAFQLIDDMLDYSAKQQTLGKTIGDDFRDGKITLPVILAIKQANDDERAFWQRTLQKQKFQSGDLETALELLDKYGALDETFARARGVANAARECLAPFPESPVKSALLDAVEFSIARAY